MLVTVLMPIYNAEKYLKDAVYSILNQTHKNFELLIIDDGSSDNSVEIVNSIKDQRIKILKLKHSGISNALNIGIDNAKGELIFRMDADDISEINRLEVQIDFMKNNNDIDLCGTNMIIIDKNNKKIAKKIQPSNNNEIINSIIYNSNIMHPTFCFRKKSILKIKGYRTKFIYAQDYDLLLRGITNKFKYYNLPDFLLKYRLQNKLNYKKFYNQIRYTRLARSLYFQRKKNGIENTTPNDLKYIENINFYTHFVIVVFFYFNKNRINKVFPRYLWILGSYFISFLHYELLINIYYDTRYYLETKNERNRKNSNERK